MRGLESIGYCALAAMGMGCFNPRALAPGDAPGGDAAALVDGPSPAPAVDACLSFSGQADTCALTFEADLAPISRDLVFDTSTRVLTADGIEVPAAHMVIDTEAAADQDPVAILVHDFLLADGAVLRVVGTRPFAVIASGRIELGGNSLIDATEGGAGSLISCAVPARVGADDAGGAGGGGGGGYSGGGGSGSDGDSDGGIGLGGFAALSIRMPRFPQGGCAGARGGSGSMSGSNRAAGGAGGLGGGAIYLAAAERIELGENALLTVSGGGGKGGTVIGTSGDAGGGGGGSGGMIMLEAPRVIGALSKIVANGGGGGEGSASGIPGGDGQPGQSTGLRAPGGSLASDTGGDGGRGGSVQSSPGEAAPGPSQGGGGGGGGGVGYIHIVSSDVQLGLVSPAAM